MKILVRIKNYFLCKKYPFLKPHNRWTDQVPEDYDYSWTEWDALPIGWAKAFGKKFLRELGKQVKKDKCIKEFRIMDIKEKYGTLRFYTNFTTEGINKIVMKYCKMSSQYCIECGKPAEFITSGWIQYLCKDCFESSEYDGIKINAKENIENE